MANPSQNSTKSRLIPLRLAIISAMKTIRLIPLLLLAVTLAACGPSAAAQEAAVQTQVALLMLSQEATQAAVPTEASPVVGALETPIEGVPPTSEALLPPIPASAACVPDNTDRVLGTVTEVFSGDSIEVDVNGADFEIRYIGLDAGGLPMDINRQLVEGKQVLLISDTTNVDEYGRLPRYVIADGVFVNLELLRQNAAYLSLEEPDMACEQAFKDAQP